MQCGKCSAGCPAADGMDILPHQVIRHLANGDVETIKNSKLYGLVLLVLLVLLVVLGM